MLCDRAWSVDRGTEGGQFDGEWNLGCGDTNLSVGSPLPKRRPEMSIHEWLLHRYPSCLPQGARLRTKILPEIVE